MRNFIISIALGSIMLSLAAVVPGCNSNGNWSNKQVVEWTDNLTAPLDAGMSLTANTSFGKIIITGAEVSQCTVIADIRVGAPTMQEAEEIAAQVSVTLESSDDGLIVKLNKPQLKQNRTVSADYDITVPRRTNISCNTSFGKIAITNIQGQVAADTSYDSVSCSNVAGNLDLKSSFGEITIENVEGNIIADTSYESVNCTNVTGDIDLHSSFGKIICRNVNAASLKTNTSYGKIDVNLAPETPSDINADVNTSFGDITFTAPVDFTGRLDMATSFGKISTDLPITVKGNISKDRLKGAVGSGTGNIKLHTSYGSIKLKQAE